MELASALRRSSHCWSVNLSATHDDPSDPRRLVRQSDTGELRWLCRQQLGQPGLLCQVLSGHPHYRRGPDYEQASQVSVALLRDAAKALLPARAVWPWRKAQPRGELAPGSEDGGIRHGRRYSRCRDGADTRYRREPLANLIVTMPVEDLLLEMIDLAVQRPELGDDAAKRGACVRGDCAQGFLDQRQQRAHAGWTLSLNDPVLTKVGAQGVDQHGPLSNQQVAGLMQHQRCLLFFRLQGNEPHRGVAGGVKCPRSDI